MHYSPHCLDILSIDLTTAVMRREPLSPALRAAQVGGRGLAGALLETSLHLAWDAPEAAFCLVPGRLAGFGLPGGDHVAVAFLSPRTGGVAISSLGGGLGGGLVRAGLAAVVLVGRATRPVGLVIREAEAVLVDAAPLAGQPLPALFDALTEAEAVAGIGPAGWAGSPLATLVADRWHDAGGAGAGLALGVKKCVFLAVSGTREPKAADPAGLQTARAAMERLIAASPALSGPCGFGAFGTGALVDLTAGRRMQPSQGFRRTFFAASGAVNAPRLQTLFGGQGHSCPGCPVGCRRVDAAGRLLPDVDALSHFSALLGLCEAETVVAARQQCLELGLDAPGAAVVLAAEAQRTGRCPTPAAVRSFLDSLATTRGEKACAAALRVKGVELPAFDPRGAYGLALSLAVGTAGPDPWRAGCLAHELLRKPVATDRFTFDGKARAVALGENAVAAAASLGGCPWLNLAVSLEEWGLALTAVTGEPVAAGDLAALGERIVRRERAQNGQRGLGSDLDDLPERFFTEPGTGGDGFAVPALDREAFLAARAKYYRLRGLDAAGRPVAPAAAGGQDRGVETVLDARAERFAARLARAGLCAPGMAAIACLDDGVAFSRQDAPENGLLAAAATQLGAACLMLVPPAEPYRTMLEFLAGREAPAIRPRDCETRTFFHDIPVVAAPEAACVATALSRRKGAYLPGRGIVAHGVLSPEQAFITVSSVAFAGFVKFFSDYLAAHRTGGPDVAFRDAFERAVRFLPPVPTAIPALARGPFADRESALAAMIEAGRATVELGLVDSVFGNISYNLDGTLAISQTGSALDELAGCMDLCPLDGSSCAGLTASSELAAHAALARLDGRRAVLHGHPRFSVILSMDCQETDCPQRDACHVACNKCRRVEDIPIVPGEVGCGPRGLVHTMPPALAGRRGAIVLGHGVFTMGRDDFGEALAALGAIENLCRTRYFEALGLPPA